MSISQNYKNLLHELSSLQGEIVGLNNPTVTVQMNIRLAKLYLVTLGIMALAIQGSEDKSFKLKIGIKLTRSISESLDSHQLVKIVKSNVAQAMALLSLACNGSKSDKYKIELINAIELTVTGLYKIRKTANQSLKGSA